MSKLEIIATFGSCIAPHLAERLEIDLVQRCAQFAIGELIDPESAKTFARSDREPLRTWEVAAPELHGFVGNVFAAIAAPGAHGGAQQPAVPRVIVKWRNLALPGVSLDGEFDGVAAELDSWPTVVRRLLSSFVRENWQNATQQGSPS